MLRKILLLMSLIFILSIGVACAAERTYEVTDGGCIVSLPEQYVVTVVERPTDPNDELGVQVAQLSISDPVNKSMTMHVMVESSKLTKELLDLNYRPGGVMKDYFAENLQNSGWQEPVVAGELQNGKMNVEVEADLFRIIIRWPVEQNPVEEDKDEEDGGVI